MISGYLIFECLIIGCLSNEVLDLWRGRKSLT